MSIPSRAARVVTGLLVAGGAALVLAPAATAAPTPSATPSQRPPIGPAPTASATQAPVAPGTTPNRIAVPAGGGTARAERGGFGPAEIVLLASGVLLVAGGAVGVRRQRG